MPGHDEFRDRSRSIFYILRQTLCSTLFTRVFDALAVRAADPALLRRCRYASRLCGAARPVGIAARALHRVRDTSEIYSRCRQVICPSGGLSTGLSSPFCKNISLCSSGKSSLQIRGIPSHTEGRFAIVTDVGHGMRWTRQRFARDGIAGRVL
jgi:hypothetical protein